MKIIGINGSPRKSWNTATLLQHALDGARSRGAETELIHLYDLNFKGCESCFSCKVKNGKSYGSCAVKDDLTPIFNEITGIDALILGSPIYIGSVTGEMKSFVERLIYPFLVYDKERSSLFKKKIPVGCVYTLGATESRINEMGYDHHFKLIESVLARILGGPAQTLVVADTMQFEDYSKYVAPAFNPEEKLKRRKEIFPKDCKKAFEMGARFAG